MRCLKRGLERFLICSEIGEGGREEVRNGVWEIVGKFTGIVRRADEAMIHP